MNNEQINIIFMGNFAYPEGMADSKRIQSFIDYLTVNRVFVKVLLLRQGGHKVDTNKLNGCYKGVKYFTIGNNIGLGLKAVGTVPLYFVKGIAYLYKWRNTDNKNILYCYNGLSIENIIFVITARIMKYKVVLDIVEDNTFIQEKLHLLAKIKWVSVEILERYVTKLADAVVVISHYLKDLYGNNIGSSLPVCFIPISARCLSERKANPRQGPLKFVYSGSFAKKDGVELLIRAFEKLSAQYQDCVLVLTGKGANLPDIQKLIANHPAIHHVGYLDNNDFYDFLQQADILCITRIGSTYANAGFPFKLGEYLATGNPVIVTNVSDVCRYLENLKDAIIIEPDDVNAIHDAMEYCLNNFEEIKKIGRNGQIKCSKYFNPDTNGFKLLELLKSI